MVLTYDSYFDFFAPLSPSRAIDQRPARASLVQVFVGGLQPVSCAAWRTASELDARYMAPIVQSWLMFSSEAQTSTGGPCDKGTVQYPNF